MSVYTFPQQDSKGRAKARRWADSFDRQARGPFPADGSPHQKAAHDGGGLLVGVKLKAPQGQNGGCGTPTFVAGTNGGTMPCGSVLHAFGKSDPYYCGHCDPNNQE